MWKRYLSLRGKDAQCVGNSRAKGNLHVRRQLADVQQLMTVWPLSPRHDPDLVSEEGCGARRGFEPPPGNGREPDLAACVII
jgi:hypothetical protein